MNPGVYEYLEMCVNIRGYVHFAWSGSVVSESYVGG